MSTETETPPFDAVAEEARLAAKSNELVERAVRKGADEAEAFATYSQVASVSFEKGDLKLAQVDDGTSYGLRVFKDKKLGFASTNQTDAGALDSAAEDACGFAGFSVPDDANVLPDARPIAKADGLVTTELAEIGLEEVVERGREFVERINARDSRIALDKADMSVSRVSVAISSSREVRATESDAHLSVSAFGMAIDGEDVGGFDYWGDSVREIAKLGGAIDETVERFCEAVLGNLAAGAAESYTGPVLFSPTAFLSIFVSPLISAASSIAVQRGRSYLAGKVGERIADAKLSILDDPTDMELAGTARFDREGQPCGRFPIVEGGVLQSYLYNAYSATVDGRESTGHASGGTRAAPGLGPHAISVDGGDGGNQDAMLAGLDRGLYVQRFSGTVKPDSGDFSGVAKSARWVENGKVVRSLKETLISGNAFELMGDIAKLGSAERIFGSARAPFAIVDGVSVTAG